MEAHPSCRCSLAPLAVNTPSGVPETGEGWFRRQPEAFQRQRMGTAYAVYPDGRVGLGDFVGIREHPQWGRSIWQRSQRDVLALSRLGRRPLYRGSTNTTSLDLDDRTPEEALRHIQNQELEYVYLYDDERRQVFIGRGSADEVGVPTELLLNDPANPTRPRMTNFRMVHNHPLSPGRTSYPRLMVMSLAWPRTIWPASRLCQVPMGMMSNVLLAAGFLEAWKKSERSMTSPGGALYRRPTRPVG